MSTSTPSLGPAPFVQVQFTTDGPTLTDNAIAYLQSQWPNWKPGEGLDTVMLESIGYMGAALAQICASMPPAALIALGTKLLGIPYQQGVQAIAQATFTVSGSPGVYDIPAGSEIDLSNVAFQTTADLSITIPANQNSATGTVQIAANNPGAFANGLTATAWSAVSLPTYVTGLTLASATSGGVDPQDDWDYLNTVAQELQLRSRSLITLIDFEVAAVTTAGIGRSVAVASGTNPRNITVYVTDSSGNAVSSAIKSTLLTAISSPNTRMVNATITVSDPTYTTVNVTYTVLALPGVDTTALASQINARLNLELSPAGWGAPTQGTPGLTWVDQPVVHLNRLIGVIGNVQGVNYVVSCSISANDIAVTSFQPSPLAAITSIPVAASPNAIASGVAVSLSTDVSANNTVGNPSFENDTTGAAPAMWSSTTPSWWLNPGATLTVEATKAQSGAKGLQVVTTATVDEGAVIDLGILPAGTYTASLYAVGNAGGEAVQVFGGPASAGGVSSNQTLTTGWVKYSVTFTADGVNPCYMGMRTSAASAMTFFIDNAVCLANTAGLTATQSFTTSAPVAVGATSIPVNSATPNVAFPSGTLVSGPVSGDLTMPSGAGNLPKAGTMTGTITSPSS